VASTTAAELAGNRFGAVAVRLGYLRQEQLDRALAEQRHARVRPQLGELLRQRGLLSDAQTSAVLRAMGIPVAGLPGYELYEQISQGGMGCVFRGRQLSMNRVVAVKVLSSLLTDDASYVQRFFLEARAAGRLNHPNIVHAIDVGAVDGMHYLVMEYVEGSSLRDELNRGGPMPEARVVEIARQVADALEYIRRHALVHRDIKPENLMLSADGTVRICDFGLARRAEQPGSITDADSLVGTPQYMAPEQINGEADIDIRADLYALGGTLFFLATGRLPYEAATGAEIMSKHLTHPVPDPRAHVPGLGAGFAAILMKLLAKSRGDRYRTPQELVEALDVLRRTAPAVAAGAASAPRVRTARRRHARRRFAHAASSAPAILAILVIVVVLVGVVLAAGARAAKPSPADARPSAPRGS
jgi:serine/threonine-protein kinase